MTKTAAGELYSSAVSEEEGQFDFLSSIGHLHIWDRVHSPSFTIDSLCDENICSVCCLRPVSREKAEVVPVSNEWLFLMRDELLEAVKGKLMPQAMMDKPANLAASAKGGTVKRVVAIYDNDGKGVPNGKYITPNLCVNLFINKEDKLVIIMNEGGQGDVDNYMKENGVSCAIEKSKCICGKEGKQLCSKCRNKRYCSRECQVQNWHFHKNGCKLMTKALTMSLPTGSQK